MYRSKTKTENIFWGFTLLLSAILTLWDVGLAVGRFSEGPTSTKVLLLNNSTFNLNHATICIYLRFTKEQFRQSHLDITSSSEILQFLGQFNSVDILDYLETADGLNTNITTMISLMGALISSVVRLEMFIDKNLTTDDLTWGLPKDLQSDNIIVDPDTQLSVKLVFDFFNNRNISVLKLIRPTLVGLCRIMNFHFVFYRISQNTGRVLDQLNSFCKSELISWFGIEPFFRENWDLICFRLPSNQINFKLSYEKLEISMDRNELLFLSVPPSLIYLDLSGGPVCTINQHNMLEFEEGCTTDVAFHIAGHFKPLPKVRSPCSTDLSKIECQLKCRADFIKEHCGCTALFSQIGIASESDDLQLCSDQKRQVPNTSFTIPGYDKSEFCKNITKQNHPNTSCESECHSSCESKIYNYIVGDKTSNINRNLTTLRISIQSFIYPVFEDIYLMDPKQFLAQMGGILSLWLGANFMVVLHVCVFWVSAIVERLGFVAKPRKNSDERLEEKIMCILGRRLAAEQQLNIAVLMKKSELTVAKDTEVSSFSK